MQKSTAINTTIDMLYYTRNGGETIKGIYIHLSFIMTVSVKKPQVDMYLKISVFQIYEYQVWRCLYLAEWKSISVGDQDWF